MQPLAGLQHYIRGVRISVLYCSDSLKVSD